MIRLRGVERADLDALFALDHECFAPGVAYSRADLRYYLTHPRSHSIVADDDVTRRIAGFIIAESYLEEGRRIAHIITIDVAPSERRKGLGRALMQAIEDRLGAADFAAVRLEVAVDNAEAQAFYRQLGFSNAGRIRGFYKGTLDAFVMEKHITHPTGSQRP